MSAKLALAFDILAHDKASATLDKVGDKAQRTGEKVEHGTGRAGKAFGLLGKTFASSSAGALGPLQELTDKMEVFTQATEAGGSKTAGRILGVGLAATAAGSFLESLHSREQSAMQQLQASIATTGHSYQDYAEEVEKAVKSGERFGNQASTTMDALNRLTITTHNPEEAFKGLQVAIDVAAAKHIPLSKAAEVVGLTFNGSTRAGKQFGLKLEDVKKSAQDLTAAQKGAASANDAAKNAQTSYTEKLDLWNQSSHKTAGMAYALRDAHTRLVEAQDKAKEAAERLKKAQEKQAEAAEAGARNVAKLAAVVKGQGAASADTFTGHLKKLGAQIEDTLGAQGKLGGVLITAGVGLSAIGSLAQAGAFSGLGRLIGRIRGTGTAFTALRDVEIASSAEGAAGVVAGAATTEAALAGEAAAAEATALRMSTAFAGLGALAAIPIGIALDVKVQKDAKNRGGILGQIEGALGSVDVEGAIRGTKSAYNAAHDLFHGKKSDPLEPGIEAALAAGGSNGDDGKLAQQRAKHAATVHAAALASAGKKANSKAGKESGDAYLKGLLGQITSQQADDQAKQAATDRAQAIVDAISTKFQDAKSKLQGLLSDAMNLKQSISSSLQQGSGLTDVFSGPNLNANGTFGHQNNFGQLRNFLTRRVAMMKKFVTELHFLLKRGLDPDIVAQIAQAGVDGGQKIAEAILSGGSSGVTQVNSLERQITALADNAGGQVANDKYAKQIAAAKANADMLGRKLDQANAHLARIQGGSASGSTAASQRTAAAMGGV